MGWHVLHEQDQELQPEVKLLPTRDFHTQFGGAKQHTLQLARTHLRILNTILGESSAFLERFLFPFSLVAFYTSDTHPHTSVIALMSRLLLSRTPTACVCACLWLCVFVCAMSMAAISMFAHVFSCWHSTALKSYSIGHRTKDKGHRTSDIGGVIYRALTEWKMKWEIARYNLQHQQAISASTSQRIFI